MTIDYAKTCFVIMPFGRKPVGTRDVDFDGIYDQILRPAIDSVPLPEGGTLRAARTDRDFFTGDIGQQMFQYLHWSRFAVADISSLNANVWYEVGVRHTARASGTALLRQGDAPIPFDVSHTKVFSYDHATPEDADRARGLIQNVLRASLEHNQLDSPVQLALRAQRAVADIEPVLREAENALRRFDRPAAIAALRGALKKVGPNGLLHMRLGLLLRDQGELEAAVAEFDAATKADPLYAEAWREKGINEGRLTEAYVAQRRGEADIRRALDLNPSDFEGLAALGGILRRQGRYDEALGLYARAAETSAGHPYPLLMFIKLRARAAGTLELDAATRMQLRRAERMRAAQAAEKPALDAPWCFFDLAELRLYARDRDGFLRWTARGIEESDHRYQVGTFRSALRLLVDGGVTPAGLLEGLATLDAAYDGLPELHELVLEATTARPRVQRMVPTAVAAGPYRARGRRAPRRRPTIPRFRPRRPADSSDFIAE